MASASSDECGYCIEHAIHALKESGYFWRRRKILKRESIVTGLCHAELHAAANITSLEQRSAPLHINVFTTNGAPSHPSPRFSCLPPWGRSAGHATAGVLAGVSKTRARDVSRVNVPASVACGDGLRPKPLVEEVNVIHGGVSYLCGSNKTAIRGGNDKAPFRVPLVLADDATGGLQQSLSLGVFSAVATTAFDCRKFTRDICWRSNQNSLGSIDAGAEIAWVMNWNRWGLRGTHDDGHNLVSDIPVWGRTCVELGSLRRDIFVDEIPSTSLLTRVNLEVNPRHHCAPSGIPKLNGLLAAQNHAFRLKRDGTSSRSHLWSAKLGAEKQTNPSVIRECRGSKGDTNLQMARQTSACTKEVCSFSQFFPFEEIVQDVVLADPSYPKHNPEHGKLHIRNCDNTYQSRRHTSDTIDNIARYVAPLCFVYSRSQDASSTSRVLNEQYFKRLDLLAEARDPIPDFPLLSQHFEEMIQALEPEICFHLLVHEATPLHFVAPWMTSAFATHLSVDQLLLLWDWMLEDASMVPFAIAAAAIVSFRLRPLLNITAKQDIVEAIQDVSQLEIIPILHSFLVRPQLDLPANSRTLSSYKFSTIWS